MTKKNSPLLKKEKKNETQQKQEEIQRIKLELDQKFMHELQALLEKYKKVPSINFVDRQN